MNNTLPQTAIDHFDENDITWIGGRFLDPVSRTFKYRHNYFKAILEQGVEHITYLMDSGVLQEMIEMGFMPPISTCKATLDGFPMVLAQKTDFFDVEKGKWGPLLIKDAALKFISINKTLSKHNFGLHDGHKGNFIVQGKSSPMWCDVGSIVQVRRNDLRGLREFISYFIYPLLIRQHSLHFDKLSRYYFTTGCSDNEAQLLIGKTIKIAGDNRIQCLNALEELVESIDFQWPESTWSGYHKQDARDLDIEDRELSPSSNKRQEILKRMIRLMKPKHAIDFGANAGIYTILTAQTGAEVLAVELDESAASKCHQNIKSATGELSAKIAISGFGAHKGRTPDLVLALALTHHLFFTHQYRFEVIARMLAQSTSDNLITEYMPNGLGIGKPHIDPLPDNYSIEHFVNALSTYFKKVEVHEYPNYSHRKLVIARERTSVA